MTNEAATANGYQVLARKYRPATFADLVGQDAMVRTLSNAFAADRIAHAFIMTGVRGVGKTTTARIIAKGMNCVGPDGKGGPTINPCGQCEPCQAIAEGRHVDVMEMDAASRTGVGDIREIIDSVRYRAASARFKIYIIDEVHMLSTSAFNALLKTLEEPPEHVKFIFATTEIRKIPVTVLSRCQRFDLRRMEPEDTMAYLRKLADLEKIEIADDALGLITRAAEGSMRDAISLLDQAIAHGAGETSLDQVRAMLGVADRGRVLDLFDAIMKGEAAHALNELSSQYADGADPMAVLRDLAEITHWTSVLKVTPEAGDDPTVNPVERARAQDLAASLPMRALSRMWQMLLKSLEEVAIAPNAMMAAEMAIIRLTHVADLPTPEELIRKIAARPQPAGSSSGAPAPMGHPAGRQGASAHGLPPSSGHTSGPGSRPNPTSGSPQGARSANAPTAMAIRDGAMASASPATEALSRFVRFEQVVDLIRANRDVRLLVEVEDTLRLAKYSPGRIEFEMTPDTPKDLAPRLASRLQSWTGVRWGVTVVSEGGAETIAEIRDAHRSDLQGQALAHPMVQTVLEHFPKAEIREVLTDLDDPVDNVVPIDPDDVDDNWDPFEED